MPRKRRTRSHVIADLSVNHVERHALACGYSVERIEHDYGIDLLLYTYNEDGELENGQVFMQLKATDNPTVLADGETIAFALERADLELWLQEPMPVILVVYDAPRDRAHWLYVQAYFEDLRRAGFDLREAGSTVTVHLPSATVVDQTAIRTFARYKDNVLRQAREVIRHEQ